jgi:5,10-methylenetetrahydromethanopterin reductase
MGRDTTERGKASGYESFIHNGVPDEIGRRMTVEIWAAGTSSPTRVQDAARRLEESGWDGWALVDSQNLAPDPYVLLALAAAATSGLKLATGVTNPLTRHPATMATAIATVQAGSKGRAILGIGRGDSSLAHLGLAPVTPSAFEHYLVRLQGYLSGQDVPFDVANDGGGMAASSATLKMAGGPESSRIRWITAAAASLPKVPVDVAASGPQVIAIAARHAERVTFAVGADPDRLAWAIAESRNNASRQPEIGAYVPVVVHPDRATARELISGRVGSFARFSAMHGHVQGPVDDQERVVLKKVHDAYDMEQHFTQGSPQSSALTPEVIDAFGVAGPPDYCIERFRRLINLGLSKLVMLGGGRGVPAEAQAQSNQLLSREVLPALRAP